MPELREVPLIAGPYEPPETRRGDFIECEINGLLRVGGWSNGRIPWPRSWRTGAHQLIVTAELARAVRTEAEIAIAYWWGVSVTTVWAWRKALGVEPMTEGTKVLWREVMPDKLPPEVVARGRARAMEPDVVERIGASLRGRPAHPNTRAALLEAAKRPKSAEHRRKISEANFRRWRKE